MKTAQITRYGGPEVLAIHDTPIPQPGPDEALVAVVASTINPVDIKTRTPDTVQQVSTFPATLGWDVAGIVLTAPPDSALQAGDRTVALHPPTASGSGSWAQLVAIPAHRLLPAPESVDLLTAATLPLAGLTAQQALRRLAPRPDERLLVTGAAGAVGGIAVQLATLERLHVTGLVSRPSHVSAVLELGADSASSDVDELDEFDAIFDTAGVFDHARLLRPSGRLVTVSDDPIPPALTNKATWAEVNYVTHDPTGLQTLVDLVDTRKLTLRVAEIHPMTQIRTAHQHVERGGLLGKVVLTT